MVGSSEDRNQQKYLGKIPGQVFLHLCCYTLIDITHRCVSLFERGGSSSEDLVRAHLALAQFADKQFKQVSF